MKLNRKGFTLIELLICLGIVVCIIWAISDWVTVGKAPTVPTSTYANLPSYFMVQEVPGWGTKLAVISGGVNYGNISEDTSQWKTTFTYSDASGVVAVGKKRLSSWRTTIDVFDESGDLLGTFVDDSSLSSWNTYAILDAAGNKIAESKKVEWGSTNFTISTMFGHLAATLDRPTQFGYDTWSVDVYRDYAADKRVLMMLAAFKTYADNHSSD